MKKRLVAILLCLTMLCSVSACGKENLPKVKEIADYSDIDAILTDAYVVTEDEISQEISAFLANNGVGLVQVTDRDIVQEGDIVNIDFVGYESGEAFQGGTAEDQWVDVSQNVGVDSISGSVQNSYIDGFTKGLLGAKVGGTAKSEVVFPEVYQNEELAGKPATFEFTIHGIYVPATRDNITDEVVEENFKEIYDISTVSELVEYTKERLSYTAIMEYLVDNSSFEISDEYVEERTNTLVEYQKQEITDMYSMDLDTYLSYVSGKTLEQILPTWKEMVKKQIMYEVLFAEIAENENLSIDEDAFKEYILTMFGESATEEDIELNYKYVGLGNVEDGKNYVKNEKLVKDFLIDAYNETVKK